MLDDDDGDDYDFEYIDQLVAKHQASAGAQQRPLPHYQAAPTYLQNPQQPQRPKPPDQAHVHQGGNAQCRPLLPCNHAQHHQWQPGSQTYASVQGPPCVQMQGQQGRPGGAHPGKEVAPLTSTRQQHQYQSATPEQPPYQQEQPAYLQQHQDLHTQHMQYPQQQQGQQPLPRHQMQRRPQQHGASVVALPPQPDRPVPQPVQQQGQGQGPQNPQGQRQGQQQCPPPNEPHRPLAPHPPPHDHPHPQVSLHPQQQRQAQQEQPRSHPHGVFSVALPALHEPAQHHQEPPQPPGQHRQTQPPQCLQQQQQQQPKSTLPPYYHQQLKPAPVAVPPLLQQQQQQLQPPAPHPQQPQPAPLEPQQQEHQRKELQFHKSQHLPPHPRNPQDHESQQQPQPQQQPTPLLQPQPGLPQPPPPPQQQQPRNPGAKGPAAVGPGAVVPRSVTFTASLALEDNKRFAVKVGYHDALKAVFGLISGASGYDHAVKGWTFPLSQYKHVMDALTDGRLKTRGVKIDLQPILPGFVDRMLHAAATRSNDERLYDKLTRRAHEGEQSLDEKMMPFQREGVRHGLKVGGRVLIGDEMGLGKTVQACCLLKCYSEDWPALVVVPKSLRETWADALFMWLKLTDKDVFVVNGASDLEQVRALLGSASAVKPHVIVASYDTLTRSGGKLQELKLKMVVLDEAHYIKNSKAQRTQAALPLLQQARRAVLLTGTPALSKPAELVPLLQSLCPAANIKAGEFSERYSVPDKRYPGKFFGSRNESELNKLLMGTVMVRRLKRDVLKHLPAKRRQQVFVRLPEPDMRKLGKMSRELEGIKAVADSMMSAGGGSGLAGVCREQQQTIMRLWRETAALKAAAVSEYCADLLEGDGAKFLLFAHHQVLLDAVEDKVKSCKAKYIRIDGSTSSVDRAESVKRFQEDADVKVAILSIQAAGVGLTMTASSLVVFAELSWVPGDIQQAEDRCHRIGQHTSVNIHFLLVRGSIDEIMWDTLQNKLGNVGKVLDGSGAFIKVDATREVHGLGASARPVSGQGEDTIEASRSPSDRAGSADGQPLSRGRTSRSGGVGGEAGAAVRNAAKSTAAAAGTRRISDYFPTGEAAVRAVGGKADSGGAGMAGQKRDRAPADEVTLVSEDDDDDERDFKRR